MRLLPLLIAILFCIGFVHAYVLAACGASLIVLPGNYLITGALTHAGGTCLSVQANDVYIDGQGYSITDTAPGTGVGISLNSFNDFNMTNTSFINEKVAINLTNMSRGVLNNLSVISSVSSSTRGMIDFNSVNLTTFADSNFTITGTASYAFDLGGFNLTITNNTIKTARTDTPISGEFFLKGANNTTISFNNVNESTASSVYCAYLLSSGFNNITNNSCYGASSGILFMGTTQNNSVYYNTVAGRGVSAFPAFGFGTTSNTSAGSQYNDVEWNTLPGGSASSGYGVVVNSATNNTVANNIITTSGTNGLGIGILSSARNNTIYNNTISTSGGSGHGIGNTGAATGVQFNIIDSNNITTSSTGVGVVFFSGSSNIVQNNWIKTTAATQCIVISTAQINDSYINNTISVAGTQYGIVSTTGTAQNITIANNTITATGTGGGISLSSAMINVTVFNNTVITKSTGITITSSAVRAIVQQNNVTTTGDGGHGITLSNALNNTIYNNTVTVSGNTSAAINMGGSSSDINNTISFNTLLSVNSSVLLSPNSLYNLILSNTITTTGAIASSPTIGGSGIYVDGPLSSGTVWNNSIVNNTITTTGGAQGIVLASANNITIANNTINSSGNGIQLGIPAYTTFSVNNTITNNTILANTVSGTGLLMQVALSGGNSIYYNNFTGGKYLINNSNATNQFNTTVGGVAQGNIYYNISSYTLTSSRSDHWADGGASYPSNFTTMPGIWASSVGQDFGPWIEVSGVLPQSVFAGFVYPSPNVNSVPIWKNYTNGDLVFVGGPFNTTRRIGTFTLGAGILVVNGTSPFVAMNWQPE